MKYRPEIDGLRAVAVLPVILFHAGVSGLHGGFIGVDIFFVISGFLITAILVQDLQAESFSIWTFYERRARRILPALLTVILACLPFAWMWMFPEQLRDFGQSVVATAVFASNILFWKETGYFSVGVDLKPLLHTWSLAIEEQFYIIFPVLLALVWRFGRKALVGLVLVIAIVSLGMAQVVSRTNPEFGFYLLPTRAWELLIGSLGAFLMLWRKPAPSQILAGLGALCVLTSFVLFDSTTPHPSLWTLVPVVGTVLILVFAQDGTIVARVLAMRPLVAIGLISYSAYLWHQPLFAFARLRSINQPSLTLMLSLAILSLVLAALTWKFVEQPFRRHEGRAPRLLPRRTPLLATSAAALAVTVGIGGALHVIDGAPWRIPESAMRYLAASNSGNPLSAACRQDVRTGQALKLPPEPACLSGNNPGALRAIIIGDSHADSFASEVRKVLDDNGWNTTELTVTSCEPLPGITKGSRNCGNIYTSVLNYLKQEDFDLIISGMRSQVLWHASFDNLEGGDRPNHIGGVQPTFDADILGLPSSETRAEFSAAALRKGMTDVLALGSPVLIVHAIPEAGWNVPVVAAKRAYYLGEAAPEITTSRLVYDMRVKDIDAVLDDISEPNLFHIRPADLFCDDDRCVNTRDGIVYYYDDNHLSLDGGKLIAESVGGLLPTIKQAIATADAKVATP